MNVGHPPARKARFVLGTLLAASAACIAVMRPMQVQKHLSFSNSEACLGIEIGDYRLQPMVNCSSFLSTGSYRIVGLGSSFFLLDPHSFKAYRSELSQRTHTLFEELDETRRHFIMVKHPTTRFSLQGAARKNEFTHTSPATLDANREVGPLSIDLYLVRPPL